MIIARATEKVGQNLAAMSLFAFVMLGNALTITLVRHLSDIADYSAFQLVFMANAIGALLCIPKSLKNPDPTPLKEQPWRLFTLRAIGEFVSFSASFYAISQLPLPMHTSLLFMSPIFGTIIALTVLREHGTLVTYGTIAIGFVGMLIITQPGLEDEAISLYGIGFALFAAFGFAVCGTIIKLLTRHAAPPLIATRMLIMTAAIAAPFAISEWQPIDNAHWPFILALGLLAFLLQHSIGMALARVPMMTVIPLNFLQLVMVSILAWWVFGEAIGQTTLIGSVVILAATFANMVYASRHTRDMAADKDLASEAEKA